MRRIPVMCQWTVILVSLLACPSREALAASPAPSAGVLELAPLIQEALDRNPEVRAIRERVEAVKERIPQSSTLEDPEFKIQLWNVPESFDLTKTSSTIYGLAQRFPFPGTLSRQEDIAVSAAERAAQRLASKEREIAAAVKVAYYEFFWTHRTIEIHHERVTLLKQLFEITNAKFRVGKGTQVDVLKVQVESSKLLQHFAILEQRNQTAQAHLNTLLNRSPLAPLAAPQEPAARPLARSIEQLQDEALHLRPELREADSAIAQGESARKLTKLRYYPHLRVELQRWQNYNTDDGYGANFTINLPFAFWTKRKYDAGTREAVAQLEAARSQKQVLENLTRFQVKDLVAQVRATEQVVKLYVTTVLPQAQQTRHAALAGYRTGGTDFLDLIDADRALITYRLEYVRALVDLEQQRAKLEQVVGTKL
jgi:outer membrane protein, heavy metal efflux system